MFTVTEAAAAEILRSPRSAGTANEPLRIAARRGDQGAVEYVMGFDTAAETDVRVSAPDGLEIIIDSACAPLLEGTTLDYVELESGQHELIFMNPNDPHYIPPRQERAGE